MLCVGQQHSAAEYVLHSSTGQYSLQLVLGSVDWRSSSAEVTSSSSQALSAMSSSDSDSWQLPLFRRSLSIPEPLDMLGKELKLLQAAATYFQPCARDSIMLCIPPNTPIIIIPGAMHSLFYYYASIFGGSLLPLSPTYCILPLLFSLHLSLLSLTS